MHDCRRLKTESAFSSFSTTISEATFRIIYLNGICKKILSWVKWHAPKNCIYFENASQLQSITPRLPSVLGYCFYELTGNSRFISHGRVLSPRAFVVVSAKALLNGRYTHTCTRVEGEKFVPFVIDFHN